MAEITDILPGILPAAFNGAGTLSANPLPIKFDRLITTYPRWIVSGSFGFSVDNTNAFAGASATIEVVADGVNAPTFTGITVLDGVGYLNQQGIVNRIVFTCLPSGANNALTYFATITQALNASPIDVYAPTLLSAVIPNAAPNTVVLTYNENLNTTAPATTAFSIGGVSKTVTGVSISGAVVTLTVDTAFAFGDTATISYTVPGSNSLRDAVGNQAAALSAVSISNQISGVTTLTFTVRSANITESPAGTYNGNNATAWQETMLANQYLPANTDGWVALDTISTTVTGAMIALNAQNINQLHNGNYEYFGFWNTTLHYGTNGTGVTNTTITSSGRRPFLRLKRTSGVITLETSPDNSVWTVQYTWPGTNTGVLYVNVSFAANGSCRNVTGFGVVQ